MQHFRMLTKTASRWAIPAAGGLAATALYDQLAYPKDPNPFGDYRRGLNTVFNLGLTTAGSGLLHNAVRVSRGAHPGGAAGMASAGIALLASPPVKDLALNAIKPVRDMGDATKSMAHSSNAGLVMGAGALGLGGLALAKYMTSKSKQDSPRVKVTLPQRDHAHETTVELPLDDSSLPPVTRMRMEQQLRRQLRSETRERALKRDPNTGHLIPLLEWEKLYKPKPPFVQGGDTMPKSAATYEDMMFIMEKAAGMAAAARTAATLTPGASPSALPDMDAATKPSIGPMSIQGSPEEQAAEIQKQEEITGQIQEQGKMLDDSKSQLSDLQAKLNQTELEKKQLEAMRAQTEEQMKTQHGSELSKAQAEHMSEVNAIKAEKEQAVSESQRAVAEAQHSAEIEKQKASLQIESHKMQNDIATAANAAQNPKGVSPALESQMQGAISSVSKLASYGIKYAILSPSGAVPELHGTTPTSVPMPPKTQGMAVAGKTQTNIPVSTNQSIHTGVTQQAPQQTPAPAPKATAAAAPSLWSTVSVPSTIGTPPANAAQPAATTPQNAATQLWNSATEPLQKGRPTQVINKQAPAAPPTQPKPALSSDPRDMWNYFNSSPEQRAKADAYTAQVQAAQPFGTGQKPVAPMPTGPTASSIVNPVAATQPVAPTAPTVASAAPAQPPAKPVAAPAQPVQRQAPSSIGAPPSTQYSLNTPNVPLPPTNIPTPTTAQNPAPLTDPTGAAMNNTAGSQPDPTAARQAERARIQAAEDMARGGTTSHIGGVMAPGEVQTGYSHGQPVYGTVQATQPAQPAQPAQTTPTRQVSQAPANAPDVVKQYFDARNRVQTYAGSDKEYAANQQAMNTAYNQANTNSAAYNKAIDTDQMRSLQIYHPDQYQRLATQYAKQYGGDQAQKIRTGLMKGARVKSAVSSMDPNGNMTSTNTTVAPPTTNGTAQPQPAAPAPSPITQGVPVESRQAPTQPAVAPAPTQAPTQPPVAPTATAAPTQPAAGPVMQASSGPPVPHITNSVRPGWSPARLANLPTVPQELAGRITQEQWAKMKGQDRIPLTFNAAGLKAHQATQAAYDVAKQQADAGGAARDNWFHRAGDAFYDVGTQRADNGNEYVPGKFFGDGEDPNHSRLSQMGLNVANWFPSKVFGYAAHNAIQSDRADRYNDEIATQAGIPTGWLDQHWNRYRDIPRNLYNSTVGYATRSQAEQDKVWADINKSRAAYDKYDRATAAAGTDFNPYLNNWRGGLDVASKITPFIPGVGLGKGILAGSTDVLSGGHRKMDFEAGNNIMSPKPAGPVVPPMDYAPQQQAPYDPWAPMPSFDSVSPPPPGLVKQNSLSRMAAMAELKRDSRSNDVRVLYGNMRKRADISMPPPQQYGGAATNVAPTTNYSPATQAPKPSWMSGRAAQYNGYFMPKSFPSVTDQAQEYGSTGKNMLFNVGLPLANGVMKMFGMKGFMPESQGPFAGANIPQHQYRDPHEVLGELGMSMPPPGTRTF